MKPISPDENKKAQLISIGHPKHLDSLVHDKNPMIRSLVAEKGTDKHRGHLVNDPEWIVRESVAWHGNENHARALLNDEDEDVSQTAKERLEKLNGKRS